MALCFSVYFIFVAQISDFYSVIQFTNSFLCLYSPIEHIYLAFYLNYCIFAVLTFLLGSFLYFLSFTKASYFFHLFQACM